MSLAFVFPGQGAGVERRAREWCEGSVRVRRCVEVAAHHAGATTGRLLDAADTGRLPTEQLESLVTAVSVGILEELLACGVRPDVVLGHSLGEIAACAASGCCTADDAIALADIRGRLMAREAARRPGGMVAFPAAERATVEAAISEARAAGMVGIAVHNAPGQWLVAGEWAALRQLAMHHSVTPVAVGGAWHCDVLADAVAPLHEAAVRLLTGPIRIPFIANRTGAVVSRTDDLPDLLAGQLVHPVEWVRSMDTLRALGVGAVLSVGPGRAVQGLVRLNLGATIAYHASETPADLERVVEACGT